MQVPSLVLTTLLFACLGLSNHDVENVRELSVSHGGNTDEFMDSKIASLPRLR